MIVGVIPARGGSKRISRKNLAECAGKPLLAWTAKAALASKSLDRVILSTENDKIARVGTKLGLEVPFLRPAALAADETPMLPVLQHLLKELSGAGNVEALVLLQATSPLRTEDHIDEAVGIFRARKAATVVSVTETPHQFHPMKLLTITQRQELKPFLSRDAATSIHVKSEDRFYGRNGPALIVSRADVIAGGRLYGEPTVPYVMAADVSIDVDEPWQLHVAELLLKDREKGAGA